MDKKKRILSFVLILTAMAAVLGHYLMDPWGFYWKCSPEETQLRMHLVQTAQQYLGYNETDSSHQVILDLYNAHEPLAVGYVVQPTDSWCATFVSAVAIECGYTGILPTECSCERQIGLFQQLGTWVERDAAIPLPGDIIYYDWDETGIGDATGWSDHVGIVVGTKWPFIKVIEGNKDDCVSYRILPLNAVSIRGFGMPDYKALLP